MSSTGSCGTAATVGVVVVVDEVCGVTPGPVDSTCSPPGATSATIVDVVVVAVGAVVAGHVSVGDPTYPVARPPQPAVTMTIASISTVALVVLSVCIPVLYLALGCVPPFIRHDL